MRLENKVAFITAAAGAGIGWATARALAAEGADVVVTDLHEGRVQKAAEALEEEFGRKFLGLTLDVADETQVNAAIDRVFASQVGYRPPGHA